MLGKLGRSVVVSTRPPWAAARLWRSAGFAVCAVLGGFAAGAAWQSSGIGQFRSIEASVDDLRKLIDTQRATLQADLRASEAMRLRLEQEVVPAGGLTDQPMEIDEAARLAGLDRQRVPGEAPTWALERIDFDATSDRFLPDAYPELAKLGVLVQLVPKTVIELGGGAGSADPQLAKLRRERVRDFLLQHFEVDAERITIASADDLAEGKPLLVRLLR